MGQEVPTIRMVKGGQELVVNAGGEEEAKARSSGFKPADPALGVPVGRFNFEDQCGKSEVVAMAKKLDLPTSGSKAEVIARLVEAGYDPRKDEESEFYSEDDGESDADGDDG